MTKEIDDSLTFLPWTAIAYFAAMSGNMHASQSAASEQMGVSIVMWSTPGHSYCDQDGVLANLDEITILAG